jgi:hypothetical protein
MFMVKDVELLPNKRLPQTPQSLSDGRRGPRHVGLYELRRCAPHR